MAFSKSIFTSKTFLLAVLQAAGGITAALMSADPNVKAVGGMAIAKSVIDVGLRLLTSDPTHLLPPTTK